MMTDRFAYSSKIALYLIAAALPLWVLPAPFGAELGREVILAALTVVAGALWLLGVLGAGEIRYPVSPILWASGMLAVVWGASAALSRAPFVPLFFAEAGAERLMTLLMGLALMIATAGILKQREEETRASAGTLLFVLIFAGAAAALMTLYTFAIGPIGFLPVQPYFNVIGTANGLALFYAALLMMTVGLLLSPAAEGWKTWVRAAFIAAAVIFLANLSLIHFRTAWIVMLGSAVCLFGFLIIGISKHRNIDRFRRFGWRQGSALALIVFTIAMIMAPGPLLGNLEVPVEVSPSMSATFSVAGSVFREGPLRVFLGSGPGTFGLDWARYKDPAINRTVFWNVRFNQGQSWAATALPTTGILGFTALLGFFAVALFAGLRMMLSRSSPGPEEEKAPIGAEAGTDALAMSVFLGFLSVLLAAFLYPANTSLVMFFFLTAGALTFLLAIPLPVSSEIAETFLSDEEESRIMHEEESRITHYGSREDNEMPLMSTWARGVLWDIRERRLAFEAPWAVFASSLAIIFLVALGIAVLYLQVGRVRALYAVDRGTRAVNEGRIDEAIGHMERAVAQEPRNVRNLQVLAQVRTEKVRQIIQRAAAGADVRQEFQSAVSLAIQDAQRLTEMHPDEPLLWRVQGALYEAVIPFIQGSERFATSAYQRAADLEPLNPAPYVEWGRAGLVFTDRIAALAQQAKGKEREELLTARTENLRQIVEIFRRALQVKEDYAPAHFLLAQTAIRLDDLDAAIRSVEDAKRAAPFDIGVAFQLGLLYYQKNDLTRAQAEFERAVGMNEHYSNARYFLGLIYDRQDDKEKAIDQFRRIEKLNPDNAEVQRILVNLSAGKSALDGIVPPAAPPEKRKDTPVKQEQAR